MQRSSILKSNNLAANPLQQGKVRQQWQWWVMILTGLSIFLEEIAHITQVMEIKTVWVLSAG
jgi:hypothetical protein